MVKTKTPQQIRNEVEKELKELKRKYRKKQDTKGLTESYERRNFELQKIERAKLSILTEYDKSIKEMIEDFKTKVSEHTQYVGDYNTCSCHQCEGSTDVSRVLRLVNKLILSKIGDVQQSKEKRNEK